MSLTREADFILSSRGVGLGSRLHSCSSNLSVLYPFSGGNSSMSGISNCTSFATSNHVSKSAFRISEINDPGTSNPTIITALAIMTRKSGLCCPSKAHRNPSITPAIGLRLYSSRHFSGTRLTGYVTGVTNIQICTRNGTAWATSRYLTFNAESQRPMARAVKMASSKSSGKSEDTQR